jgi:hypothetical protein
MPFGMTKLFEGQYQWKMPADVEINIGATRMGNLPKTFLAATEKYAAQNSVEVLPNGHYVLQNYQGGYPFPESTGAAQGLEVAGQRLFRLCTRSHHQHPQQHGGNLVC